MNKRELEALTKRDLSTLAREAEIVGRSSMTKAQLVEALTVGGSEPVEAIEPSKVLFSTSFT